MQTINKLKSTITESCMNPSTITDYITITGVAAGSILFLAMVLKFAYTLVPFFQ